MRCPFCACDDDRVVDSRAAEGGRAIRRRRRCERCDRRYTTYERVEEVPLLVRKRSGEVEAFEPAKLLAGLERAATDRIAPDTLAQVAASIERELREVAPEVGSDAVGLAVLEALRRLDHVAYLRFASVYKDFTDLSDFEREVGELQRVDLRKASPPKIRG